MTRHTNRSATHRILRSVAVLGVASAALLASGTAAGEDAAPSENGLELVVPQAHQDLGAVYHTLKGKDAQVTFTSDAPLEFIKGTSNQVIGYAIAGEGGELLAGEFHLPIESIDTGIPMRDQHMQGDRWLGAGSFPNVVFRVAETTGIKETKSTDMFTTYEVTLVGDMTIKGVTREMSIPATITRMPESAKTKARFPGDLLAIRCSYPILLSDFGIGVNDPGISAGKVADELTLETRLFCSTASPEAIMGNR